MARRVSPLILLVAAVVVAACRAQPTEPPSRRPLFDEDNPACVDTVYYDSTSRADRSSRSTTGSSSTSGCHVVVIWY